MRTAVTRMAFGVALAAALAGCGSSGGGSAGGHPDTGFGANQAVPAEDCTSYCQRQVDCVVDLCDEDTGTTNEQQFETLEINGCEALCTDSLIQNNIPAADWTCLFTDSCRQVFGENSCHVANASYSCMAN